jgi:hypothetical protein
MNNHACHQEFINFQQGSGWLMFCCVFLLSQQYFSSPPRCCVPRRRVGLVVYTENVLQYNVFFFLFVFSFHFASFVVVVNSFLCTQHKYGVNNISPNMTRQDKKLKKG